MATVEEANAVQTAIDAAHDAFEDFKTRVADELSKAAAALSSQNAQTTEVDLTPQVDALNALRDEIATADNPVAQVPDVPATEVASGGGPISPDQPGGVQPGPGEQVGPGAGAATAPQSPDEPAVGTAGPGEPAPDAAPEADPAAGESAPDASAGASA